jgi:hypothetical protein
MWIRPFVSTFHTLKYSIWAKSDENFLQKVLPTYFSTVHNLRLGSIKLLQKIVASHKNQHSITHVATICNLVIFLAKSYKSRFHTTTDRSELLDGLEHRPLTRPESVGVCDMHLVIFLAKSYKSTYRTSTNRSESESVGVCDMRLVILWPRVTTSRRQLVPYLSTISILNISTKVLTTNPG